MRLLLLLTPALLAAAMPAREAALGVGAAHDESARPPGLQLALQGLLLHHPLAPPHHPPLLVASSSLAASSSAASSSSFVRPLPARRRRALGLLANDDNDSSPARDLVPDVTDRATLLVLANMSNDAYYPAFVPSALLPDSPSSSSSSSSSSSVASTTDGKKDERPKTILEAMQQEDGWGRNGSFGWETDALRGYIWTSTDPETSLVVVALKGTDIFGNSSAKDRIADLLMFSCCCGHVDYSIISQVCSCASHAPPSTGLSHFCSATCIASTARSPTSYFALGLSILRRVQEMYPQSQIWLTGHSLGGSIANLVSRHETNGERRVYSVSFNAPADRLFSSRLALPSPPFPHQFQFGTLSDPIFTGQCNGPTSSCYYAGIPIETKCRGVRGASLQCVWQPRKGEAFDVRAHRITSVMDRIQGDDGIPKCVDVEADDVCGSSECKGWGYN